MVSVSILLTFVLSFGYYSNSRLNKETLNLHRECVSYTRGTLDKLKTLGVAKSVAKLDDNTNEIKFLNNSLGKSNVLFDDDEIVGEEEELWIKTGSDTIIRNYLSLRGVMSTLNAIYNKDSRFCSTVHGRSYRGSAPMSLEDSDVEYRLKSPVTTLKIEVYNILTGERSCNPWPVLAIPGGSRLGHPQSKDFLDGITVEDNGRSDIGFWITATTSYIGKNNSNQKCSLSSLFSYSRIAADENELRDININMYQSAPTPQCATGIDMNVDLTGFAESKAKAFVMVCKDESTFEGPAGVPVCPGGAVKTSFTTSGKWVRCNEVTLCGKAPDNINRAESNLGYNLRYSNLGFGCRMSLKARYIDIAHNISAVAASQFMAPLPLSTCRPCTGYYTGVGWCPRGGRTMENTCSYNPPPPPSGGSGSCGRKWVGGGRGDGSWVSNDGGSSGGGRDGDGGKDGGTGSGGGAADGGDGGPGSDGSGGPSADGANG